MALGTVFITGIHTGLGRALASHCLDEGARVYAVSRTVPEQLVDREGLHFAPLDLRRFDEVAGRVGDLLADVEGLDLVLLNAGVLGELQDLSSTTLDELRAVMDINVWANKVLIDALLGGHAVSHLVAISSGAAFNGSGGWGAYSISKAALNLLARVYAHEHPETHFTALAPGLVDTPMIQTILAGPDEPRYAANGRIRAAVAEGRLLPADQVAAKVLACLPQLRGQPSGAYADIRQLAEQ